MPKHKHAEIIKAWADGADIETTNTSQDSPTFGIWGPVAKIPNWNNPKREFRIKDPYQELKDADAAGKIIQFKSLDGTRWLEKSVDCEWEKLSWSLPVSDYRIKPEPKPDEIWYCLVGKGLYPHLSVGSVARPYPAADDNVKFTFDGESGELKSVELIK